MKRISAFLALTISLFASSTHAQYAVKLSSTASSSAAANPSLTDNYRASASARHFSMINSAPATTISYIENDAASGAAYCYQASAVLSGGRRRPSNLAVASVSPPTGRQSIGTRRGPVIGGIRCLGAPQADLCRRVPARVGRGIPGDCSGATQG
jgi:hypothetical protein